MNAETMQAVRLTAPGGPDRLVLEQVPRPEPGPGEALVRVHAAALTRNELDWPLDRLPAIPSHELSGVVESIGPGVDGPSEGDEVLALTAFDRDGAAAEYALVSASLLASKPAALSDPEAAAIPMPGMTAWQGLFDHGGLEAGQRVLIHGATGGVGQAAIQLAHWRGAQVIGTVTGADDAAWARELGADEAIDHGVTRFEDAIEPVDLVFDTVGGERLARSRTVLAPGGRLVGVAEEGNDADYFVVEHDGDQLKRLAELAGSGDLRVAIDSVLPLARFRDAFERVAAHGKRGKVVLEVSRPG
jgi:NADPH:quinone reductase-like Zn-dependent oxidoreductase